MLVSVGSCSSTLTGNVISCDSTILILDNSSANFVFASSCIGEISTVTPATTLVFFFVGPLLACLLVCHPAMLMILSSDYLASIDIFYN